VQVDHRSGVIARVINTDYPRSPRDSKGSKRSRLRYRLYVAEAHGAPLIKRR
jgi:hypothetical protein